MITRRIPALLCAMMLVCSLILPASAVEPRETVIDLGNGFSVVETITQGSFSLRSGNGNMIYGQKTGKLYQGSTQIGTVTLAAAFDLSGTSVKATQASISASGLNGWSYDHGTSRCSYNVAYGSAVFKSGSTEKRLDLSLSCSPDGSLS